MDNSFHWVTGIVFGVVLLSLFMAAALDKGKSWQETAEGAYRGVSGKEALKGWILFFFVIILGMVIVKFLF